MDQVSQTVEKLFGPRFARPEYELPTKAEVLFRWRIELRNLIARAIWEEAQAYSHRNARYGVSMLACRRGTKDEDRFTVVSAPNFTLTPRPRHRLKMCGERTSKSYAEGIGYDYPVGVVVYSNNMQPDDASGIFSDVQHPCGECGEMLLPVLPLWAPLFLFRNYGIFPCEPEYPNAPAYVTRELTFGESLRLHNRGTG